MKKENIKKIVILVGIIIIPLIYSFFYLKAFWDPYATLSELPVAIVNEDSGTVINDENRNLGNELKDELKTSDELNFIFVDMNEANEGLENEDYYAIIRIPEDFSSKIAIATEKSENKTSAVIDYMPNEKANFLASQILGKAVITMQDELKANISKEITEGLSEKLREVPSKLDEVNSGISQLYDGASTLNEGTSVLSSGASELNNKYLEFNSGINDLKNGIVSIDSGSKKLSEGINDLLIGSTTLSGYTKNLYQIDDGVKNLNIATENLSDGIDLYVDGVNQYIDQNNSLAVLLQSYIANNPSSLSDTNMQTIATILNDPTLSESITKLKNSGDILKTSTLSLNTGVSTLAQSTADLPSINTGVNDLKSGLQTANAGSSDLVAGVEQLNTGVTTIYTSSNMIQEAVTGINEGTKELNAGTVELKDGLNLAQEEITSGIKDTNIELESLDGLSEFMSDPVQVSQNTINPVPNYGTGFTPYFMSLSLWVGGLMIFFGIYLDADGRFKILSRKSDKKKTRAIIYLVIGLLQSLVLAIVIKEALNLQVSNVFGYYLICGLISLAFISIIQFLMVTFKDVGKFLVILLLILQLTSCGGTFPMELVPKFFNDLYIFMPMTYSVNLLKDVISGGVVNSMSQNIWILSGIFIVFTGLTLVTSKVKAKRNNEV